MAFDDPVVAHLTDFIARIGIEVEIAELEDGMVVPGIAIRDGRLLVDPARLQWPGDLLHEAGHIAVTDPALRPTLTEVPHDPGEEMAAIAWSWAAALAAEVDPALVFHEGGYRGGSVAVLKAFGAGDFFGVPMLQYFGMSAEPRHAAATGLPAFPEMARWLR